MRCPTPAAVSSRAAMVYATYLLGTFAFLTACEATRPAENLTAADGSPTRSFETRFHTVAGRGGRPAEANAFSPERPRLAENRLVVTASTGGGALTE